MGKVILPLSDGELPEKTIFDRRFVVECCETFHLHWRNLRLELSADNWIQLVEAFEQAIATWRAHGSPRSHPHLELARFLMDTSEVVNPRTANAELCENLYKTLRETHGADAEFWEEDAFVHFHYRDLRVEMPIADFLAFSRTMAKAHTKLRSHTYRPLADLFRQLDEENIVYVVLRNWERLPESVAVGPHSDLDLLVHPAHVARVDELWRGERTHAEDHRVQRKVPVLGPAGEQSYILVDIRSTDDGYMPEAWSHRLLSRRVPHKMFYVLEPRDYFVSLLYHVVAHKGVMSPDYARRLVDLAAAAGIETSMSRIGDFREACRLFAEEGVEISAPRDVSVLPKLPYLDPPATVISSRLLDVHEGRAYVSRVAAVEEDGRPIIRKQTTFDLAEREHAFLTRFSSGYFPRAVSARRVAGGSVCEMELVDGYPLADVERFAAETSPDAAREFLLGCVDILAELRGREVTHRDIRPDNILVRDGRPVLIDFGWAVAPDLPYLTPAGLGDEGRAPEGFCDTYAMGVALTPVLAHYPHLLHVVAAMTQPSPEERVTDPAALRELVAAGAPTPEQVAGAVCRLAERAIASGSLEPARDAVERALELADAHAGLLAIAGTLRLGLGDAPGAVQLFERALEIDPEHREALRGLADAAADLGRLDEARGRYASLGPAPAVTIVIPVFNRVDLTRQCLAALEQTTPAGLYDVVVVDNGSTDETVDFLRRARAAGRLRVVANGENLGFGRACNLGASLARGEHVVLLNNDTIPGAGWLEALLDAAREDGVGIAGSRLLYPNGRLQHAGIALQAEGLPYHIHRNEPAEHPAALERRDYPAVTGASMLVRRDLYELLGGFDEAFEMYVEDVDLCLRAWDAGLRVVYCPESVLVHLESASVTDIARRDAQVRAGWQILRGRWEGRFASPPWAGAEPAAPPPAELDGVRSFAVLAFADELVVHPDLFRAYTDAFTDADDISLVIYAAGREPADIVPELGRAMQAAGVDEAGCPDLLVVAVPGGRETELALAGAVHAAYTRRELLGPFAGLSRFDDSRTGDLGALAEGHRGRLAA